MEAHGPASVQDQGEAFIIIQYQSTAPPSPSISFPPSFGGEQRMRTEVPSPQRVREATLQRRLHPEQVDSTVGASNMVSHLRVLTLP
jgi:hypothetical protein